MTDPRDDTRYGGVGYFALPYKIDDSTITYSATSDNGSAQVGLAVNLSTDDTVQLVGDGEDVLGKLIKVESDDVAVVQIGGFCTLPGGDSATLTLGEKIVGDLGAESAEGYVRAVNTATAAELGHARHRIQNNDTTTAVVVQLGV